MAADDMFLSRSCGYADCAPSRSILPEISSSPIRTLRAILGVVAVVVSLAISSIGQVNQQLPHAPTQGAAKAAPSTQNVPPCASPSSNSSLGHATSQAGSSGHSVTLSWKASIPRSTQQQDAIQGYYVYRSGTSNSYNDANQMNSDPLPGTQCIDTAVAPRGRYFYVVRAVAANGKKSDSSNEAPVEIPFP